MFLRLPGSYAESGLSKTTRDVLAAGASVALDFVDFATLLRLRSVFSLMSL